MTFFNLFVTPDGFEPPLTGPKPVVLPLDERVILWAQRDSNPRPIDYESTALTD